MFGFIQKFAGFDKTKVKLIALILSKQWNYDEMNIFESNLKLFKASSTGIEWDTHKDELVLLVLTIIAESQQDLIISSPLYDLSTQQLHKLTKIKIKTFEQKQNGRTYTVDHIRFRFPEDLFKPTSITFIKSQSSTKSYNTLILSKAPPKLTNLTFQWLKAKNGVIIKPLRFNSEFIISTLNFIINALEDKTKLGDVSLSFKPHTQLNALNDIQIDIPNKDTIKFSELGDDLLTTLYDYLKVQTSIDFEKIPLTRFKCNYLLMTNDGKLKVFKGVPELGSSTAIKFTVWDILERVYNLL